MSRTLATQICERQVLRYAGYSYDQESCLYYLSARHYDPATRQFLSKDLSRNDGEQSAYQYCGGNPVANVDPTGLQCVDDKAETERRHRNAESWKAWYRYQNRRVKGAMGSLTRGGQEGPVGVSAPTFHYMNLEVNMDLSWDICCKTVP